MNSIFFVLKILFLLIVAVLIVGVLYEQYTRYSAKKSFIDNGSYVDIDGRKLHYHKDGSGKPLVVFESGLDFRGHLVWKKVQGEVAKFATTISYDRAGILRSERGVKDKTCKNMAEDLHTMLEKIKAPKPYILVAHSLGGLVVREYVDKYGDEVAGVIFVDVTNPEQISRMPEYLKSFLEIKKTPSWLTTFASNTGIIRVMFNNLSDKEKDFIEDKEEVNAYFEDTIWGVNDEVYGMEAMLAEVRDINSFSDIPLTVMTATKADKKEHEEVIKIFNMLAKESLALSSDSKYIEVDSTHYIQLKKPEMVIEAIKEMAK